MRWEKSAFCRHNGNFTVRFFTSHAFHSHLHAEFQNCNKIAFKLLLNHSKRGQYKTGDKKPRKACIGCTIPVITTLTSNLRIIPKKTPRIFGQCKYLLVSLINTKNDIFLKIWARLICSIWRFFRFVQPYGWYTSLVPQKSHRLVSETLRY